MTDEKIKSIGEKLNVSEEDLKNIEKKRRKMKVLYPLTSAITIICSGIFGYIAGKKKFPYDMHEYPYFQTTCVTTYFTVGSLIAALILTVISSKKGNPKFKQSRFITIVITTIVAIIIFALTYSIGAEESTYGSGALYNVFSRKERIT